MNTMEPQEVNQQTAEPVEPAAAPEMAPPTDSSPTVSSPTVAVEDSQWYAAEPAAQTAPPPVPDLDSPAAPAMDAETLKLQKRVTSGRTSIGIGAALSLFNLVSWFLNLGFSFPFSLTSPYFLVGLGMGYSEHVGSNVPTIIGTMVAVVVIGVFGLLCVFSKKSLVAFGAAGVMAVLDILLLVWIVVGTEEPATLVIDVLFECWLVGSILWGFLAARKLRQKAGLM